MACENASLFDRFSKGIKRLFFWGLLAVIWEEYCAHVCNAYEEEMSKRARKSGILAQALVLGSVRSYSNTINSGRMAHFGLRELYKAPSPVSILPLFSLSLA